MSNKTFSLAAWLLIVCGGLLITAVVVSKRMVPPWQRPPVPPPLVKIQVSRYPVRHLGFSSGEKTIVSDGRQWSVQTGKPVPLPIPPKSALGQARRVSKVSFSSSGKVAMIWRRPVLQRVVNYSHWGLDYKTVAMPNGRNKVQYSGKKKLYTQKQRIYVNRGIDFYDARTGALLCSVPLPDDKTGKAHWEDRVEVKWSCPSADGSCFFLLLERRYPKQYWKYLQESQCWDVRAGRLLWKRFNERADMEKTPYMFFADNKTVMRAVAPKTKYEIATGELKLYNQQTNQQVKTFATTGGLDSVMGLQWAPVLVSPNQRLVAAVSRNSLCSSIDGGGCYSWNGKDSRIYVWDARSGQLLWTAYQENFSPGVLLFSPDSKTLATAGEDHGTPYAPYLYQQKGKLFLWNTQDGTLHTSLEEQTTQDRWKQTKELEVAKIRGKLRIFTPPPRRGPVTLPPFAPGDSGPVNSLSFSSDGKLLAAGYGNGSIKIWRIR